MNAKRRFSMVFPPVRSVWRAAWDFVYPRHCPYCGLAVAASAEANDIGYRLCRECRRLFRPQPGESCLRCGAPSGPHLDTHEGCHLCRSDRFAFQTVVRLGVYEGPLQQVCLLMKNPQMAPLAAAFAELLWDERQNDILKWDPDFVVAVPGHWSERVFRKHSAAATLAERLSRRLHTPWDRHILTKRRRTAKQISLPPSRRRTNLKDAFRIARKRNVRGTTALLVDDVLTTGSTAHEVSKVLRKAGVDRVIVAVLARGLGR